MYKLIFWDFSIPYLKGGGQREQCAGAVLFWEQYILVAGVLGVPS